MEEKIKTDSRARHGQAREPEAIFSYKTEIRRGEPAKVGEDSAELVVVHSEPGGKRREILVNGCRGNPAAGVGIVWSVDGQRGELAVSPLAFNRAAQDEVMAAPAMVGARRVAGEGASEIAGGKRGDVLGKTELLHGALEGEQ